jgi:hypothetical protein
VLLGLKHEGLTRYTGWVTAIEGWVTAAIPAFLLLTGLWQAPGTYALALGVFGVVVFTALVPMTRHHEPRGGAPAHASRPDLPASAG